MGRRKFLAISSSILVVALLLFAVRYRVEDRSLSHTLLAVLVIAAVLDLVATLVFVRPHIQLPHRWHTVLLRTSGGGLIGASIYFAGATAVSYGRDASSCYAAVRGHFVEALPAYGTMGTVAIVSLILARTTQQE
jgi:hypothetical protein